MEFRNATARGTNVSAYLNASVNYTTLLTGKPKACQTSFTTDKGFKNFCSSHFQFLGFFCRKVERMIFYPPLTFPGEKPRNVCFQLPLHGKPVNNFFVNFSTSCEMFTSCSKHVSFCRFFYSMDV